MVRLIKEKKKILLVDDDEIHLTTAEFFLKKEYEIYKAKSGEEALEYLCNDKISPSVIMLDIIMPNMNGWEVFKKIRTTDFLKNIPVIFLTAVNDKAEREKAFKWGIADYIVKPFNMTLLISCIQDVIKKYEEKNTKK